MAKFLAKRHNEHLKSIYSLCNTFAAAIIGASYVLPVINGAGGPQELDRPLWIGSGLAVCAFGHLVIRKFWRRED